MDVKTCIGKRLLVDVPTRSHPTQAIALMLSPSGNYVRLASFGSGDEELGWWDTTQVQVVEVLGAAEETAMAVASRAQAAFIAP